MPQMVTARSRALQPIKDVLWALAIALPAAYFAASMYLNFF